MAKNCVSYCDLSTKMNHNLFTKHKNSPEPHLYLRNNIFYCRMTAQNKINIKKVLRFSLHTTDYYEARQIMYNIKNIDNLFKELTEVYKQITFKPVIDNSTNSVDEIKWIDSVDENTDKSLLEKIYLTFRKCSDIPLDKFIKDIDEEIYEIDYLLNDNKDDNLFWGGLKELKNKKELWIKRKLELEKHKKSYQDVKLIIYQIHDLLYVTDTKQLSASKINQIASVASNIHQDDIPNHTIGDVIERMKLDLSDKVASEQLMRKQQDIENILSKNGFSINDKYNKINNQITINKFEETILKRTDVTPKTHNRIIRCINSLTHSAKKMEPDYYKDFCIDLRSEKKLNSSSDTYLPYTKVELLKMYNPEEKFFIKHPDIFYSTMLALYCGVRTNGGTTLRYSDIIKDEESGILVFDFKLDDDDKKPDINIIKKLKTASTIRKVPIHSRLIELGFLDYINKYKERNSKKFQNLIFKRSISISRETKEQVYNVHFMRPLFDYLKKIGIKKDRWKAFHSFRNTLSNALEDCGVSETFINKIGGWKGTSVRQKHYSSRQLIEIQGQLEKLKYPFLDESLDKIVKEIMTKYKINI